MACLTCGAGKQTAEAGLNTCSKCPEGRAAGSENSTTCHICGPGRFALGVGNVDCPMCPSGFYATGRMNYECKVCDAGTACPTGTGAPKICPAGWYSEKPRSTECQRCSVGYASLTPKSAACVLCKSGRFAPVVNSTECTACDRGMFVNASRSEGCFFCPRGWADLRRNASAFCRRCPVKWRSSVILDPGLGSTDCIPCRLGEVQPPDSGKCHFCSPGTFSLYPGEQSVVAEWNDGDTPEGELPWAMCHACSEGAICRGGHGLKALNGFWRSSNYSTIFTKCFEPLACMGASRREAKDERLRVERNESCAVGYTGRLCHMCSPGYGREGFDKCNKCPPKKSNLILTGVGVGCVLIVMVSFIIFSIKSSGDADSISSMMFKTLAAYGQVVGIASLFPYKWPILILKLFETMDMVTSVSDRILNTDCSLEDRQNQPGALPLIYEKAILYMLAPPIFVVCAVLVFLTAHCCITQRNCIGRFWQRKLLKPGEQWTFVDTKRCIIVAGIVAMVIMHPTLVRQAMFLLMCVDIEGRFFLRKNVQLECGIFEHNLMSLVCATPAILVYVLMWPALVYRVLNRRRHKLHAPGLAGHATRSTYGFLYKGYSKDRFYWVRESRQGH